MSEVRWKKFILNIILAIFSSTYQLKLIENLRSSDRKNFAQFFLRHSVYIYLLGWFLYGVKF